MKTKQPPKGTRSELDRDEWFFCKIPESELKACFIYEYARELRWRSPAALDRIVKSEGDRVIRVRPERSKLDFGKIMRDYVPDFLRISNGKFPDISWQKLDQKVRLMLVEAANKVHPEDLFLRDVTITSDALRKSHISTETLQWANQPVVDNEYLRETAYGLEIKFNKPDSGIKRAFAQWLSMERKRRGLAKIKYKRQTGRGGFWDRLNGLGALRLVNRYRWTELVNYTSPKLKNDAYYSSVRDLRAGAKKAYELLEMLLKQIR
jgi:hypothetical protein